MPIRHRCRAVLSDAPAGWSPQATNGSFRFVVEHLKRHFEVVYGIPAGILPDADYPTEYNPGSFGRLTRAMAALIPPDLVSTAQAAADARDLEMTRERQAANAASGHLGGESGHLGGGGAENGAKAKHATKLIEQLSKDGRVIATFPSLKAAVAVASSRNIGHVP